MSSSFSALDQRDAVGFEALAALDDIDADALTGGEFVHTAAPQRGDVNENVLAPAIWRDEAIALVGLEPLDRAVERLCRSATATAAAITAAAIAVAVAPVPSPPEKVTNGDE